MSEETPVLRIHQTRSRSNPGGMDVRKVIGEDVLPFRSRKPAWFKVPRPGSAKYRELSKTIADEGLYTVCKEAACPNIGDCWDRGTATFMILGDTCTRRCGFCNVKTGKPTWNDPLEPLRVARSVAPMGLRHAVIIDPSQKQGRANVGSTVKLLNVNSSKEQVFHLVSPNEVDPAKGKISIESPVGHAVINRVSGEEVFVEAPSGRIHFRVLEVID